MDNIDEKREELLKLSEELQKIGWKHSSISRIFFKNNIHTLGLIENYISKQRSEAELDKALERAKFFVKFPRVYLIWKYKRDKCFLLGDLEEIKEYIRKDEWGNKIFTKGIPYKNIKTKDVVEVLDEKHRLTRRNIAKTINCERRWLRESQNTPFYVEVRLKHLLLELEQGERKNEKSNSL